MKGCAVMIRSEGSECAFTAALGPQRCAAHKGSKSPFYLRHKAKGLQVSHRVTAAVSQLSGDLSFQGKTTAYKLMLFI